MSNTNNSEGRPYIPSQRILFPDDATGSNGRTRKRHMRTILALIGAALLIAAVLGEVVHLANRDTGASVIGQE